MRNKGIGSKEGRIVESRARKSGSGSRNPHQTQGREKEGRKEGRGALLFSADVGGN
jgi:hypothetical protein